VTADPVVREPAASWLSLRYWRAMALFAELFKQDQTAIEYWERIRGGRPHDAGVVAKIAFMKAQNGGRPQAIQLLEESLRMDPKSAYTWFNLGYLQQEEQRHDEALASFDQAVALDAKLDRAWYGKALSLIKLGRLEEAIQPLQKNVKLQPMSPYGYYQLAHLQNRLGLKEDVATTILRLSRFEPKVAKQLEKETGVVVGIDADL
jgi:tetratricopeptide (TPR) repeat protein